MVGGVASGASAFGRGNHAPVARRLTRLVPRMLPAVHETPDEIAELQGLLDRTYAAAGSHLLSIHTAEWRLSAEQLCELLQGMCVLNLATVNSKGAPVIGPVDGVFHHGRWFFGSSKHSLKARHIEERPGVAVAYTRGEELSVTTHGIARPLDKWTERAQEFRRVIVEIYGEQIVAGHWNGDVVYWELEPRRMFAIAPKV
jgi:pyridoxamine 5'-phosphate oxidase-like protein